MNTLEFQKLLDIQNKNRLRNKIKISLTLIVLILFFLFFRFGSIIIDNTSKKINTEYKELSENDLIRLYHKTDKFVKNYLKSPASAEFPLIYKLVYISKRDSNRIYDIYEFISYVDSQNSFGATLRTYYSIKIHYYSKNEIVFIDLDFY